MDRLGAGRAPLVDCDFGRVWFCHLVDGIKMDIEKLPAPRVQISPCVVEPSKMLQGPRCRAGPLSAERSIAGSRARGRLLLVVQLHSVLGSLG